VELTRISICGFSETELCFVVSRTRLLSRHGKTKGLYKEEFPKDSTVQIAGRAFLENFLKTWKLHHELAPQQLNCVNKIAKVKSVGFYHGGGELKGLPGTWHEKCLSEDRCSMGGTDLTNVAEKETNNSIQLFSMEK
jgi:hypothetical protein